MNQQIIQLLLMETTAQLLLPTTIKSSAPLLPRIVPFLLNLLQTLVGKLMDTSQELVLNMPGTPSLVQLIPFLSLLLQLELQILLH